MNLRKFISAVLAATVIASGTVFAADLPEQTDETEYSGEYNAFDQIAEIVAERYIDDSYTKEEIMAQGLSDLLENNESLLIALLKSTLESMDDYSEFYTPEEYKAFQEGMERTFYGIGITMRQAEGDYVEITGFVEENSKAEKAGFRIGDKIYKVDGVDVTGWDLNDVREKVIGDENTTVNITVLRDEQEIDLMTTRVAVHENTVSGGVLEGNIGYIQIISFNSGTAVEFQDTLNSIRDKNVEKIILDLRNNGGGLVSPAIEIAQQIVPKGKIIDVTYRQSEYNVTYKSELEKQEFDFIVLVNENTASAAEILASAMQDSGVGILLGTTTYGKAVIQNMYPLKNGAVFKLTVGQYITRNGNEINHIGLTPDEYIENTVSKIDESSYTPFDFETKATLGNSSDNVKAAKERLQVLGFYEGDTDSKIFDKELKEAISSFQSVNNLFSYGILDIPTQVKINEAFSDIEITTDEQLLTAYKLLGGSGEELSTE